MTMNASEAKANQDRIINMFGEAGLGWWYGTRCKKCCGVYPKFKTKDTFDPCNAYYECEVCGRRTVKEYTMPWLAEEAWNRDEVTDPQMNIFQFIEGSN